MVPDVHFAKNGPALPDVPDCMLDHMLDRAR